MFNLKHLIVKIILLSAFCMAGFAPVDAQDAVADAKAKPAPVSKTFDKEKTRDALENTLKKSGEWTGDKVETVQNGIEGVNDKVETLQKKARPIKRKIQSNVSPSKFPGAGAVRWLTQKMSVPALLLVMVFGFAIYILGFATTTTRD